MAEPDTGAHERRHHPGAEQLWNESWYFDFAAPDGSIGGYVRLGLYPNLGVSWYWAYLVGTDRPLVAVRHHEAALPVGDVLQVREDGLWSQLHCETPDDHWTIGLEAFGVAMDDPSVAYGDERGDKTALGFDLEWEAVADRFDYPGASRYEQSCKVTGEVLVGDERIELDGWGQRDHSWGVRDWWRFGWVWTSGRLDDGTAFHGVQILVPGTKFEPSYVVPPGTSVPVSSTGFTNDITEGPEPDRFPTATVMKLHDLEMDCTPVGMAPVRLDSPDGRMGRFPRALCRYESRTDSRTGWGWTEWNQPPQP